jgi:hypothetical protein
MKTFRHKLRFPVFGNYPVKIVFCDDIHKEAKRAKHVLPSDDGSEEAYTAINSSGCTCVFNHTPDAETVAHEAYHAIVALLKFSGASAEEELVAYHLGYLVSRITKWREKDHAQAVHSNARQVQVRGDERSESQEQGRGNLQQQAS